MTLGSRSAHDVPHRSVDGHVGLSVTILSSHIARFAAGDFEPEKLKDKQLVIRGYDSSCADPNVYLMQAKYTY